MDPATKVVGRRVGAFLIDGLLLWAVSIGLFLLVAKHGSTELSLDSSATLNLDVNGDRYYLVGGQATLFSTAMAALWIGYLGVLPGVTGWTLGKRATGVRVVREDGSPAGPGRGALRSLLWIVDGFPYFLPGLTGFIVAQSTRRHQRVGDQIAQTYVVRAGAVPETDAPVLAPDAPPASAAPGWYADPRGEQRLRYWDGHNWTAHTAP